MECGTAVRGAEIPLLASFAIFTVIVTSFLFSLGLTGHRRHPARVQTPTLGAQTRALQADPIAAGPCTSRLAPATGHRPPAGTNWARVQAIGCTG